MKLTLTRALAVVAAAALTLASCAQATETKKETSSTTTVAVPKLDLSAATTGTTTNLWGYGNQDAGNGTQSVVTIASVTGLAADTGVTKVLKVSPANYGCFAVLSGTLPAALSTYTKVTIRAYFPYETITNAAGKTAGNNYYKDLNVFIGSTVAGLGDGTASVKAGSGFVGKIGNVPQYAGATVNPPDAWYDFEVTLDKTNVADIAAGGTVYVAVGLHRPAVANSDDYYVSNVTFK